MTDAELLRAMAQWYRDGHKFSPLTASQAPLDCGCFYSAANPQADEITNSAWNKAMNTLGEVIGIDGRLVFFADDLEKLGWTGPECTDDAIAACEIAADLAS